MEMKILKVIEGESQNKKGNKTNCRSFTEICKLLLLEFYCLKKKKAIFSYRKESKRIDSILFFFKFNEFFLNLACLYHLPAGNKKRIRNNSYLQKILKGVVKLSLLLFHLPQTMTICPYNCDLIVDTHSS